ncbi:hypothetical protein BDQ17DRAFT_577724 [Cyathus striatus]|nr:hypothetical protein BDQ17DRAFT_577724 [Cyathus striatus]
MSADFSQISESNIRLPSCPASAEIVTIKPDNSIMVNRIRRELSWFGENQLPLEKITENFDMALQVFPSPLLRRIPGEDGEIIHNCGGYLREKIVLTPEIYTSAIITYKAPRIFERCTGCDESIEYVSSSQDVVIALARDDLMINYTRLLSNAAQYMGLNITYEETYTKNEGINQWTSKCHSTGLVFCEYSSLLIPVS